MADRRFVVLDRDGTIIVEKHYLSDPDAVELIDGAGAALRRLAGLGLGLVVVTNQSAVGRGLFDLERLAEIHARLESLLAREGVWLAGIYACPHHPEEDCACRKPRTALVERAARELGFEPRRAFVVGDMASDVELGCAVGATTVLVRTGHGAREAEAGGTRADHVVADLAEAATLIERLLAGASRLRPRARGDRRS
jgi:D-glycero-D-manno-heptose 1,7-bisphosphate phosphatase